MLLPDIRAASGREFFVVFQQDSAHHIMLKTQ